MSNFFISIGFLITAIQIFINKKIVRAYDGVDYSLMGDYFYLVPGIASLAGAILFFWIGYRSITFKNSKKEFEDKWCDSCGKAIKVGKDTSWCPSFGKPLTKFNYKYDKKAPKK